MLYAIIESGDKQFRVEKGMRLSIPLMDAEPDSTVTFDRVLLCSNGTDVCVGTPTVENARVEATCVGESKGDKIRVFKMKRRKKYRRHAGHRQAYTDVRIDTLDLPIDDTAEAEKEAQHQKDIAAAVDAQEQEELAATDTQQQD